MSETARAQTAIDAIAEQWVETLVEHDPTTGTYIGRWEADAFLPDYSPEGAAAFLDAQRETLSALRAEQPVDAVDRVTKADLSAELELSIAEGEAGEHLRDLNVIESPSQGIRDIFDLMATETPEQWEAVRERLRAIPEALAGYQETLREGVRQEQVAAIRQVTEVAAQAHRTAGTGLEAGEGFFAQFVTKQPKGLADDLQVELGEAACAASAAYMQFAEFLETEIAPKAPSEDAFGRERYERASEGFLGARVDLDETYEWGIEELARMRDEQERIAAEILGTSVHPGIVQEAIAHLEQDAQRKLHGTDALKAWMQETSDRAVRELGETQFDIPEEIRTLECMIAPTQEGGIYYTGPSDDFSRPGRMWWSVPQGVTEFDTWRELTTVYHEGVPGHHLQIGQAVVNRGTLNEWRRQLAGTSGHAEGWALYAERLMEELGYLDDPADRFGMLDGQRMRAARVVLDIGVHLGKQRPDGGGVWDGDYAFSFMRDNVNMNDGFVRFEVLRYLGWGGQAPSYKVGQRIWEELRDEARTRAERSGRDFDVRDFHRDALALGGVRLDTLQQALRGEL
ncbi:DUF885 domain-containing protein [Leucobacter chinensis]|uniref:DUF885 domain-containing protein n=1 Tax=Leucobacter chinensis TaxID=2851010 RepID=UPI001C2421F2|nr:DUF885 domain-containing protein [Leucobacter chinensis]